MFRPSAVNAELTAIATASALPVSDKSGTESEQMPKWAIYSLLAALCWGISYSACAEAIKKIDRASYVILSCLTCVVVYGIWDNFSETLKTLTHDKTALCRFLIADVFGLAASYLTYLAMSQKNATMVAALEITYPLWCLAIGFVFLEQRFSLISVLGIVCIIGGVVLIIVGE